MSDKAPSRQLLIMDKIDDELARKLISSIHEINAYDDEEQRKEANHVNKKHVRRPVTISINSPGGGVYAGFAIINAMLDSQTPVITYCSSVAFSMAACIFLAGSERIVRPNSIVMFHPVAGGNYGDMRQMADRVSEMEQVQTQLSDWIVMRSRIRRKQLDELISSRGELYLRPEAAIQLKVATRLRPYS